MASTALLTKSERQATRRRRRTSSDICARIANSPRLVVSVTHLWIGFGAGEELEGNLVFHPVHSLERHHNEAGTVVSDSEHTAVSGTKNMGKNIDYGIGHMKKPTWSA